MQSVGAICTVLIGAAAPRSFVSPCLLLARWLGHTPLHYQPAEREQTTAEGDSWPSQPVIADGSAVFRGWNRRIQNFSAFSISCSTHFLSLSDPVLLSFSLLNVLPPLRPSHSVFLCMFVFSYVRVSVCFPHTSGNATAGSFVYVHLSSYLNFSDGWCGACCLPTARDKLLLNYTPKQHTCLQN